jgi:hypothetical protein
VELGALLRIARRSAEPELRLIDVGRDRCVRRSRALVFVETAMGDVAVFYWRAKDPRASLRSLAASAAPFDAWLRDQAASIHPVSLDMLTELARANVMVGQYPHAR